MKNYSFRSTLWGLVALVVLSSCGKDGGSSSASTQPLTGKVHGNAWTYKFGTARSYFGTNNWVVTLYNIEDGGDPCTAKYKVNDPIFFTSFSIKELATGSYDSSVGTGKAVSLTRAVDSGSGLSSFSHGAFGTTAVTKVNADTIEGEMDVKANDENYVRGKFTAKICKR